MNLPPSIEDMLANGNNDWMSLRELAYEIAHEACRLQREADWQQYSGCCHELLESSLLIVEDPK
jgi:hypothetical protein